MLHDVLLSLWKPLFAGGCLQEKGGIEAIGRGWDGDGGGGWAGASGSEIGKESGQVEHASATWKGRF